jgi:hypothetical protein
MFAMVALILLTASCWHLKGAWEPMVRWQGPSINLAQYCLPEEPDAERLFCLA